MSGKTRLWIVVVGALVWARVTHAVIQGVSVSPPRGLLGWVFAYGYVGIPILAVAAVVCGVATVLVELVAGWVRNG